MSTTINRSRSVLIADDDDAYRETLRDIVEPEGYRALLASSAEEAIEIIQGESIHIALFDLQMPRMTGLEAVQVVHTINARLPCILVTANATQGDHPASVSGASLQRHSEAGEQACAVVHDVTGAESTRRHTPRRARSIEYGHEARETPNSF